MALRNRLPALRQGSMEILEAGEALLVFDRAAEGQRLRCAFNLSGGDARFSLKGRELIRAGHVDAASLGPYAAVIEEIG